MVEYSCEKCGKSFGNLKSHFERHVNKKFKCIQKNDITIIAPKNHHKSPINTKIYQKIIKSKLVNNVIVSLV